VSGDIARPIRVLYIEDDPVAVRDLPRLLHPLPHVIDNEESADVALAKLESGEHHPDIVLTDLLHPGPNGWQLCEYMKRSERLRHLPIVFFSTRANPFFVRRAVMRGAEVGVPYPLASDDLLRLIVEVTVLGPRPSLVARLLELRDQFFCADGWLNALASAS